MKWHHSLTSSEQLTQLIYRSRPVVEMTKARGFVQTRVASSNPVNGTHFRRLQVWRLPLGENEKPSNIAHRKPFNLAVRSRRKTINPIYMCFHFKCVNTYRCGGKQAVMPTIVNITILTRTKEEVEEESIPHFLQSLLYSQMICPSTCLLVSSKKYHCEMSLISLRTIVLPTITECRLTSSFLAIAPYLFKQLLQSITSYAFFCHSSNFCLFLRSFLGSI